MSDKERLLALASLLAKEIQGAPEAPKLRLVRKEDIAQDSLNGLDSVSRMVMTARIRDLGRMYSLGWLVRQETRHVSGQIECLPDDELIRLQWLLERARECCVEGVGFDEAGLVRNLGDSW